MPVLQSRLAHRSDYEITASELENYMERRNPKIARSSFGWKKAQEDFERNAGGKYAEGFRGHVATEPLDIKFPFSVPNSKKRAPPHVQWGKTQVRNSGLGSFYVG